MAGLSAFLALLVGATFWLVLRDEEYVAPPPDGATARIEPAGAAAALEALVDSVRSGDREAAAALAPKGDPTSRRALRTVVVNAQTIPVRDFSLRYLDQLGGVDEDGRWSAAATVTWAFDGFDRGENLAEVEVGFVAERGRVAIEAFGGDRGRAPLWLTGPVEVRRGPETLVVAAEDVETYDRLARRAVTVVQRVVPEWRARLVVEVPRDARALDRALGADPGTFAGVAGVTSPPDGTVAGKSPVHVFLNPERQQQLRRQGTQIVLSHEAAHVALGATDTSLPVWLTEGVADYIALRDVRLPLETTASQIIRQVRREGPPSALPDDEDFDDDSPYFGAAYEAAWLACRMLARHGGEDALLRFYRRAEDTTDFDLLFRSSFGIGVEAFTGEWRRSLSDLAS